MIELQEVSLSCPLGDFLKPEFSPLIKGQTGFKNSNVRKFDFHLPPLQTKQMVLSKYLITTRITSSRGTIKLAIQLYHKRRWMSQSKHVSQPNSASALQGIRRKFVIDFPNMVVVRQHQQPQRRLQPIPSANKRNVTRIIVSSSTNFPSSPRQWFSNLLLIFRVNTNKESPLIPLRL